MASDSQGLGTRVLVTHAVAQIIPPRGSAIKNYAAAQIIPPHGSAPPADAEIPRKGIIMKKYTRIIAFLIILAIAITALTSCGSSVEIGEVREILRDLIPKSEELNVIYFGEGLPISSDREVVEEFYASFDSDIEMINYHPVDPDCGYTSEDEIRSATLEVYTEEYAEYLFERAFVGITAQLSDGEEDVKYNAIYAMYIMQNGTLTVRLDLADEAIPLGREYDIDAAEIVRSRGNYVIVSVPSVLDGVEEDIELRLTNTANGWRLDSPTY